VRKLQRSLTNHLDPDPVPASQAAPGSDLATLIAAWVAGWTVSRGTAAAQSRPEGFRIDVGTGGEAVRYVLTDASDAAVRQLAGSIAEEGSWLKIPRPPAEIAALLGPGWTVHRPEYLMGLRLHAPRPLAVPAGFGVAVVAGREVVRVRIQDATGAEAASGRMALTVHGAVMDQVVTARAHRRRGLGSIVMSTLTRHALGRGKRSATLLASEQGRLLYASLGWATVAPFTAASYRRPAAAPPGVTPAGSAPSLR
jgi:GNAT superfamily N-acetyltransferase